MITTQATRNDAQQFAANNADLYAFLRGITVEFVGTAGDGVSGFTGSGVVVKAGARGVTIATAKHNLDIAAAGQPDPVGYFTGHIQARLWVGRTTRDAPVVDVHIPDNPNGVLANNGYDVALVRVTNAAFSAAIATLTAVNGVGNAFLPRNMPDGDNTWVMRPLRRRVARIILRNGQTDDPNQVEPTAQNYTLVHMGYGNVQGQRKAFEFRVLEVPRLGQPALVDATHDGWTEIFTYGATPADTADVGDSGGPIFAVSPAPPAPAPAQGQAPAQAQGQAPGQAQGQAAVPPPPRQVALVGVHSGGNYFANAAEDRPNRPIVNNAMTITDYDRLTIPPNWQH